ncbi:PPOX class F420-dependent oxidoreductase [Kibdelosporangium phytohabitans]|uniref:Pyridoxamine 5'-phosphate oxidase n=1 Tax=Kibdelosporangium phytohabitans TaxID=860235 RepID=A0A0N9HRW3_9PSEU|nr:PPOX class F420-dependent oxidoreductase [Kibdelosporangium phytohabitans]ALG05923.1 pyridoxamine 5'-phosphate oxidase [Kibdelosporangium phytohabitans]MBE1466029.1 PPOX class probable F420-dependent enzyme [Kibdelosporangium phytohabitans]
MASLPDNVKTIVDGKNFATIATINADGSPQTSVVWIGRDGDDLLVSTVKGRLKDRNLRRDPRVSVTVVDHENPYNYFEARGTVTFTEKGGSELINTLSHKYTGGDYTGDEGTDNVRVIVRITPEKLTGYAL